MHQAAVSTGESTLHRRAIVSASLPENNSSIRISYEPVFAEINICLSIIHAERLLMLNYCLLLGDWLIKLIKSHWIEITLI